MFKSSSLLNVIKERELKTEKISATTGKKKKTDYTDFTGLCVVLLCYCKKKKDEILFYNSEQSFLPMFICVIMPK